MFEDVNRPGRIGTLAVPNRIVMGSVRLGFEARDDDGKVLGAFYAERVRDGAGLIITEGSAVDRAGAAGGRDGLINEQSDALRLRRVAEEVHAAGGRIALQLSHAGRYADGTHADGEPREMSEEDIWKTVALFARGAFRASQLGFDGVEVTASADSLIDRFLSPLTNRRSDDWGGDAARRRRFGMEILRAIRRMLGPDLPVIFRISGTDPTEGGAAHEETLAFARALAHESVDALNVEAPARYAAAIKNAVGSLPVIAGDPVDTLAVAESILATQSVDFVSLTHS
ncbi:hypothetical protein EPN42_11695 [bacterium]|nr:MAG: hypothetical protein EPN42_11695 [bacterium]